MVRCSRSRMLRTSALPSVGRICNGWRREGQQPMGQGSRPVCRALRIGEMASQVIVAALIEATFEQAQGADDAAQEVVEVMGEATGELTDRFHLLCRCSADSAAARAAMASSTRLSSVSFRRCRASSVRLCSVTSMHAPTGARMVARPVTHVHRPPEQPALALAQQHAEVHFEIVATRRSVRPAAPAFAVVVVHALEQVAQVDLAEALHAHRAQHGGVHVDPLARELPIEGPRARDQQRGIQAFVTFLQLRGQAPGHAFGR